MAKKQTTVKPDKIQTPVPSSADQDPEIMRARAKAASRVFDVACAAETLGNLLQNSGPLDEGDAVGVGSLQVILGETLMGAYHDLQFLQDAHPPAA